MNCPCCGKELEKGTASFMTLGQLGYAQVMMSYSDEEQSGKDLFDRKSINKLLLPGREVDSYCCRDCKLLVPVLEI